GADPALALPRKAVAGIGIPGFEPVEQRVVMNTVVMNRMSLYIGEGGGAISRGDRWNEFAWILSRWGHCMARVRVGGFLLVRHCSFGVRHFRMIHFGVIHFLC